MRMWRRMAVAMIVVILIGGCAFIKPTTQIKMNPITRTVSIYNTKDVDLLFELFIIEWTKEGGALTLKNFSVSDKSTPVIQANVEQMMAFVEQQRAANEGIIGSLQAIAGMVNTLSRALEVILPGSSISLDTPLGGGAARLGVPDDGCEPANGPAP